MVRSLSARLRQVIAGVPRGKVITYGGVAAAAGVPGAARLTVRALRAHEGLPWHRVVAAGGRIALDGLEGQEQRRRLAIEGVRFRGGRVRMDLHLWSPPPHRTGAARSPDRPSLKGGKEAVRAPGRHRPRAGP